MKTETPLTISGSEALGHLRRELNWTVGEQAAQGIFTRLGFSCGQTDAAAGIAQDHWGTGVLDINTHLHHNEQESKYLFTLDDSAEARAQAKFYSPSTKTAQCGFISGYLTGWVSEQTKEAVYFLETACAMQGHARCEFEGRKKSAWGPEYHGALQAFQHENMAMELESTRYLLRMTKDRYQNLFEQSSVPMLVIDPDTGALLDSNVATGELSGYTHDELLKLNIFDLFHPRDHQETVTRFKKLLTDKKVNDWEISLKTKTDIERMVAVSGKILAYDNKQVIHAVMRDITDLKISEKKERDLQNQLQRNQHLSSIGRLAASVAHEIKNPLGAIRNAIYYIRDSLTKKITPENDPQLKVILKLAEEEVDSAVMIIEELLDFSRVVQLVPRKININEVVEHLPHIITPPPNVSVAMDLDVTLPSCIADPDRLRQVFCNIMNNAIQAMPKGGELKIKTRFEVSAGTDGKTREMVSIAFSDSGMGIDPIHLSKIFEPLFTTKVRGTGLGLTITNNIVEKHDGEIQVASQLGKGTTFTVKLPLQGPAVKEEN
jgi:PAS domain S-box-containing protein